MKLIKTLVAASLSLVVTHAATAAEFHTQTSGWLYVNSTSNFNPVDVHSSSANINFHGSGGQFSGYFAPTQTAATQALSDSFLRFFCIELAEDAGIQQALAYTRSNYANDNLRKLFDIAYPGRAAGDFVTQGRPSSLGLFANSVDATAFQLAVWELSLDSDKSLRQGAAGSFYATGSGAAVTQAQSWLNAVGSYTGTGYQNWQLSRLDNAGAQNYVTAIYVSDSNSLTPPANTVPEPGLLGLLGLALAGWAAGVRRR